MNRTVSWVLFAAGLSAAVGAWLWWRSSGGEAPAAPSRPPFVLPATLSTVERGALEARATLTGTVRSVQTSRLGFAIGGSLASIDVREGDIVKEGAPIAALDDRDQAARLAAARADTALAREELAALEAPARPEEIRRLEAEARSAEAEERWLVAEVERLEPLATGARVSQSAYEDVLAKRDAARGRLEASRQALAVARAGARREDVAVQRARVAAREAAEALAQREIDKTRITAPFDGQVARRLAGVGDAVSAGQAVLEIVDLEHREIEVEIPPRHAERIGARPRVDVTSDERPGVVIPAFLDARVLAADARSRSYRGLVRLGEGADDEGTLRPGTFVRVTLHLEPLADRLLVPTDAVRLVERGSIVVKAAPPPVGAAPEGPAAAPGMPPTWTATWVPVRVLGSVDGRSAVEPVGADLVAGDRVVVVGVDRMFPGAPILPRETPRAAPPAAGPP